MSLRVKAPCATREYSSPSSDTEIVQPFVAELGPSPHVGDGSIPNEWMSIGSGSRMSISLGCGLDVGCPAPVCVDQPSLADRSIAALGPQPASSRSGPVKPAIE